MPLAAPDALPLAPAAAAAGVVVLLAWRARALTGAGACAAAGVGTVILLCSGWPGGAVLAAFFVSSSAVSRGARSSLLLDTKGSRRDAWQVLANGGAAAAGAAAAALWRPAAGLPLWIVTGALATAAADTWATAIGSRSTVPPRHILTGRAVPAGTSGGITLRGSLGGLLGAGVTALTAGVVGGGTALLLSGAIVGWVGMFGDSVIGAAWQGRFHCPTCAQPSEWPRHRCGARTRLEGGCSWLTNDGVNALTTLLGALAGGAAWWWHSR